MRQWNKKVLAVLLQWDYGIKERGVSLDKTCFYDNLQQLVGNVEVLWYDEYLNNTGQLQKVLINKARECKPDLVFFILFKDQFAIETLDLLKSEFATFAWFGDDQWRFDSYSAKLAPHFTYVATTDLWSVPKYKELGINPILSQWAAQPYSDNIGPLGDGERYDYDVSFVGGYNRYRGWFIDRLAKLGIKVECFGAGWSNGRISFEEMEQIFRRSKINLNISNSVGQDTAFVLDSLRNVLKYFRHPKNAEQIKARNFEIPLAGGFQLTNFVLGLERYLVIGEEVAVYTSVEECANQVKYFLENEELRQRIIERSHQRAKAEHTYRSRLEKILQAIWTEQ